MADRTYTLIAKGKRIPVTREVYKAYYQEAERFRHIRGRAKAKEISLNCLEDGGAHIQYRLIPHTLEELHIEQESLSQLQQALKLLKEGERRILVMLFYEGSSEQKIADSLGITQQAVSKRVRRALRKLKNILEILDFWFSKPGFCPFKI